LIFYFNTNISIFVPALLLLSCGADAVLDVPSNSNTTKDNQPAACSSSSVWRHRLLVVVYGRRL